MVILGKSLTLISKLNDIFLRILPKMWNEIIFTAEHDRSLFAQAWQHHWHQSGNVTSASIHVLFVCFSPSLFVWPRRRLRLMRSSQDWRRSHLLAMGLGWERFDGSAAIHLFWFDTMFYSVVGLYSLIWFAIDPGWRKIPFDTLWFGDHKSKLRLLSGSHQLAAFAISWSSTQLSTLESLTVLHTECPSPCETICFRSFQCELEQPCVNNQWSA